MIEDLNTKSVYLMRKRRHREAGALLHHALMCLQAKAKTPEHTHCHDVPTENLLMAVHPSTDQIKVGDEEEVQNSMRSTPGVPFAMYDRAFLLSSVLHHSTPTAYRHFVSSAVVLYNLGLAYHLSALKTGVDVEFESAQDFYAMSYRIMSCSEVAPLLQRSLPHQLRNDLSRLLMALFNNMAHINAHFSRLTEMNGYLVLLETFMNLNEPTCLDDEYLFFYFNCSITRSAPRPAPAA
jgi:hypothetical protein